MIQTDVAVSCGSGAMMCHFSRFLIIIHLSLCLCLIIFHPSFEPVLLPYPNKPPSLDHPSLSVGSQAKLDIPIFANEIFVDVLAFLTWICYCKNINFSGFNIRPE